jgi:hypothetical protein
MLKLAGIRAFVFQLFGVAGNIFLSGRATRQKNIHYRQLIKKPPKKQKTPKIGAVIC